MNAPVTDQTKPATAFSAAALVPNALLASQDTQSVSRASKATIYAWIADGLFPPPVKLGAKSSAWPASEVNAVLGARISGKSDDEIRTLVIELVNARQNCV